MASEGAECYIVERDGYTFGPYRSEMEAERRVLSFQGDRIMWLTYDEIDEYGYVRNWND